MAPPDEDDLATELHRRPPEPIEVTALPGPPEDAFDRRYADRELLGRGGMGEVRLCRDRRIGRDVALKVMHGGAADSGRFVREALVQGQLEHPGVVPVYDVGVDPDGAFFFTMKRVRGQSLKQVLDAARAGNVPQRRLLSALGAVCLAVDFAHHRGVVHRDLKPANVMLGDFGEVYVLDWGVAKVLGAGEEPPPPPDEPPSSRRIEPGETPPTLDGAVLGTPGYMAPEQLAGVGATPRSDVYALGAMLFEALTLEPLHGRGSAEERMGSTLLGDAEPARARLAELDAAPELAAACLRATARDPEDRFASPRELFRVLERFLDGDRDAELRRTMSREHAAAGEALAREARTEQAVRELGRALALDPTNAHALATLGRVLATPPKVVPPEVARELQAQVDAEEQQGARLGVRAQAAFVLAVALFIAMGIRSVATLAVFVAAIVASTGFSIRNSRRVTPLTRRAAFVSLMVLSAALGRLCGPLLVAPALIGTIGGAFSLHNDRRERAIFYFPVMLLATFGPFALELLGVLPPSYRFERGALIVLPNLAEFAPDLTLTVLAVSSFMTAMMPPLVTGAIGDMLRAVKLRVLLQAWLLRHLAPQPTEPPAG